MADDELAAQVSFVVVLAALALLVTGAAAVAAWEPVDEGNVKVHKSQGAVTGEVYEPGWHFRMPLVESTVNIPTRPQTYTMAGSEFEGDVSSPDSIHIISQDGQEIHVDVTVRYRVPVDSAVQFHSEYRDHGKARGDLIRPTVRSTMRDEGSAMQAENVITKTGRQALAEAAREALQEDFSGAGMELERVQVRNMHLNPEYSDALEAVQIEEKRHEREVISANADAEAEVIRAEGAAEAYEIRADAIEDNEVVLTEAYIEALDETDTVYIPIGEGGIPRFIDVSQDDDSGGGPQPGSRRGVQP